MADRIQAMRKALVDNLKDLKNPRSWKHITDQIGMFAYSGLSRDEVKRLREHHVCINRIIALLVLLLSFHFIFNFASYFIISIFLNVNIIIIINT